MMPPFKLTKAYILDAFSTLAETTDLHRRNRFFRDFVHPQVKWTITGSGHALAGTTDTLDAHAARSFDRLGKLLVAPIEFTVLRVIIDATPASPGSTASAADDDGKASEGEEMWACLDVKGKAERKSGRGWYENEYCWLTRWDDEGRIVEAKTWHDTAMVERLLDEDEPSRGSGN